MQVVRVGVIRGGSSNRHYSRSISDGSIILRALREHIEYSAYDILIDKKEVWHLDGVPIVPSQLIHKIDIAISTIDEPLEKNGFVDKIMSSLGIKCIYTPKDSLRGYIPHHIAKEINAAGVRNSKFIQTPEYHNSLLGTIHNTFSPPYTVGFVNKWGDTGYLFDATNLDDVVDIFTYHQKPEDGEYMIEEYVAGDEWAVTVVPDFRGAKYFTLHPVYTETIYPAFRSNIPKTISSRDKFAAPVVRETLDLYARLAASTLDINVPTTFTFRHFPDKKPVLMRVKERHILHNDHTLLNALKENAISESEFIDILLKKNS